VWLKVCPRETTVSSRKTPFTQAVNCNRLREKNKNKKQARYDQVALFDRKWMFIDRKWALFDREQALLDCEWRY
jgi:hypothetical protein